MIFKFDDIVKAKPLSPLTNKGLTENKEFRSKVCFSVINNNNNNNHEYYAPLYSANNSISNAD